MNYERREQETIKGNVGEVTTLDHLRVLIREKIPISVRLTPLSPHRILIVMYIWLEPEKAIFS